jgi:putative zincin peptidase
MSLTQPRDRLMNLTAHAHAPSRPLEANAASPSRAKAIAFTVTLMLAAVILVVYRWTWSSASLRAALVYVFSPTVLLLGSASGFVVHEILRGLCWAESGRMRSPAIKFMFKGLIPRAYCHAPISAAAYRLGLLFPGLILGVTPALLGLALGHGVLTVWGAIIMTLASGDWAALWATRAIPARALMHDHPQRGGCLVISKPTDIFHLKRRSTLPN